MRYPWYAWMILAVACAVIGTVWVLAWLHRSPWVGWTVGSLVLSVPLWLAAIEGIKRR